MVGRSGLLKSEKQEKAVITAQLSSNQGWAGGMRNQIQPRNYERSSDKQGEDSRTAKDKTMF